MNYSFIDATDIANGPGFRVTLFVSGCSHHCKGCFNKESWDKNFGKEFGKEQEDSIINALKSPNIQGLTLLGGEPWETYNQEYLVKLLRRVKRECPDKNIWSFSGYTWEELNDENSRCYCDVTKEMLSYIDILIEGEFHKDERDVTLVFRGSRNQRIINVKESIKENKAVEESLY